MQVQLIFDGQVDGVHDIAFQGATSTKAINLAYLMKVVLLPLAAYLCGSIPFGLILTRLSGRGDIRLQGSGNIGATNVRRIAGNRLGALTLLGDVAKGALPVMAGRLLLGGQPGGWAEAYLALVLGAALAGHLYPLYLGLHRGGKGVATFFGAILVLYPLALGVALLVFVLLLCVWGRASIASMGSVAVIPLAVWYAGASWVMTIAVAAGALWIISRHRDNLRRLWQGREPRSL